MDPNADRTTSPQRTQKPRSAQPRRNELSRSQNMTRTSDYAYGNIRSAVDTAASRIGVENSRLAKEAQRQLMQTKKQWDKAEQNIRGYIQKNPEKAAMIAAGVGVAIGAALAAMMKNSRR